MIKGCIEAAQKRESFDDANKPLSTHVIIYKHPYMMDVFVMLFFSYIDCFLGLSFCA